EAERRGPAHHPLRRPRLPVRLQRDERALPEAEIARAPLTAGLQVVPDSGRGGRLQATFGVLQKILRRNVVSLQHGFPLRLRGEFLSDKRATPGRKYIRSPWLRGFFSASGGSGLASARSRRRKPAAARRSRRRREAGRS